MFSESVFSGTPFSDLGTEQTYAVLTGLAASLVAGSITVSFPEAQLVTGVGVQTSVGSVALQISGVGTPDGVLAQLQTGTLIAYGWSEIPDPSSSWSEIPDQSTIWAVVSPAPASGWTEIPDPSSAWTPVQTATPPNWSEI